MSWNSGPRSLTLTLTRRPASSPTIGYGQRDAEQRFTVGVFLLVAHTVTSAGRVWAVARMKRAGRYSWNIVEPTVVSSALS
jgi:hypothetical protein